MKDWDLVWRETTSVKERERERECVCGWASQPDQDGVCVCVENKDGGSKTHTSPFTSTLKSNQVPITLLGVCLVV